jgi:hypothetical protein
MNSETSILSLSRNVQVGFYDSSAISRTFELSQIWSKTVRCLCKAVILRQAQDDYHDLRD